MKFRTFITCLALLLFCCHLSAQTRAERAGQRAANRAENKVQNKTDRTIDKAVDDAFNAVGNLFKKKKKKPATTPAKEGKTTKPEAKSDNEDSGEDAAEDALSALGDLFGGGQKWEPYTNPQTFSLTMTTTEVKRNGKTQDNTIHYAVTTDRFAMVMTGEETERTQMILNTQDGYTTMVSTDKKGEQSGVRMRMPTARVSAADVQAEMDNHTYERTGERRTIAGYNCEKVIVTDNKRNRVTEAWLTQDLPLTSTDVFGGMARAFGGRAPELDAAQQPFEGFPVLSIMTEPSGKKTTITFSNIQIGEGNYDRSLLDTGDVPIQRLGGF